MEGLLGKRLTIASYPGGKSDWKKHRLLYLNVPGSIDLLIEPFAGLANFFIVTSPRVKAVHLNELNPSVFSLLQCIRSKELFPQLVERVRELEPVERDDYYHWKRLSPSSTLEHAIWQLVILNCSVSGAGGGYSREKAHRRWYTRKVDQWQRVHELFTEKLVRLTDLNYLDLLHNYPWQETPEQTFVYLDPPYHRVAESGRLYNSGYNSVDLGELSEVLRELPVPWLMSNRDSPEVRSHFSKFHMLSYTGYNDMSNKRGGNPELIVSNYPLRTR